MEDNLDAILDQCIDRLNAGDSVEDCLKDHPEFVLELEPLLRAIAQSLAATVSVSTPEGKTKGRQRLLEERARLREQRAQRGTPLLRRFFAQPKLWLPAAATLLMIVLALSLTALLTDGQDGPAQPIATATPSPSPTAMPGASVGPPVSSPSPEASPTSSPAGSPTATPSTAPEVSPVPSPTVSPSPSPTPPPSSPEPTIIADAGILEFRVTDVPAPEISEVWMTISNIEVHRSGEETGWETVISEGKTFELLALQGIEEVLGSHELEPGHYTQIRLSVDEVIVSYHDESGTQTAEAEVPSEKVKLVGFGSFEIESDKTTIVTLDFDALKSVNFTGQGKVHFQPTVNVLVGGFKAVGGDAGVTPEPQSGPPESPGQPQQTQQSGNGKPG